MNIGTDIPVEEQRRQFFYDLQFLPLTAVEAHVDSVTFLSPMERMQIKNRVRDRLADRKAKAVAYVEKDYASFNSVADRVLEDKDAILAELDEAIKLVRAGRIEFAEYQQRFRQLTDRMNNVQRRAGDLPGKVEAIHKVEDDPEAWMQEMEKKYPAIKEGLNGRPFNRATGSPTDVAWTRTDDVM